MVAQDYDAGLESGMLDPDKYLPKYINAFKDAGVDKIIQEKQNQLDAWIASGKK
nr:DUF3502 domain-containing protein [Xylanivirga thermophila]